MQKTVIYIDIEDDITAIIGKVKGAKEKIVALVPPKRVGVLQSAVNLRLLARAAKQVNKHIVLISSNTALTGLAAAASIPAAKNLQSKPELAEVPVLEVDDGDDIIDGAQLPIGELAKTSKPSKKSVEDTSKPSAPEPTPATTAFSKKNDSAITLAAAPKEGEKPAKARTKNPTKIPNFNTFRKKLILGIAALLVLVGVGYWAFAIAPHATIVITAKTNTVGISSDITIKDGAALDAANNTLGSTLKTVKKTISADFKATGSKDIGEKAAGKISLSNRSSSAVTVAAGTKLSTNSGLIFVVNSAIQLPAATLSFDCDNLVCPSKGSGAITAEKSGTNYNAATGSLSGGPNSVSISISDATSGGTSEVVKVIQQSDIDAATQSLQQPDQATISKELESQFSDDVVVLSQSFVVQPATASATPKADERADGGKVTQEITYTLTGVSRADISSLLDNSIKKQIGAQANQKVYDNGLKEVKIASIVPVEGGYKAVLQASAKIGPTIDNEKVKEQSKGSRLGDVQSSLTTIQGVENVDVKFSPFWVSSVPNDIKKITVEFKINNG